MSEQLKPGLTRTERVTVDPNLTIGLLGDEYRVYTTPKLIYDMEVVCRNLLLEYIAPGKDSVGTQVEIADFAATQMGRWSEITVTVTEVSGQAVTFEFLARDGLEPVAKGRHSRFVVDIEKIGKRLRAKLAKATEAPRHT
ncbi:MAG TPA: hypothetical protein VN812_18250 [Candidatus Acidoferrales bacterium]|nr:hypothetical protein [Candidatus Acidoferrales bacterium]